MIKTLILSLLPILTAADAVLAQNSAWSPAAAHANAGQAITEDGLRSHIRFLADDLLEGRGPGSRGDELAQLYISTELQSLGIKPAADNQSWYQPVPLQGLTTTPPAKLKITKGADGIELQLHEDYVGVSGQPQEQVSIEDAELVFVGYGIQAPEYNWDDFKGVDVRGKILVFMNNDPESDPGLFAGRRRLYYGRWDYKYEKAAELGAAGALIIHTTASAGYPYQVVQTGWSGEEFELASHSGPRTRFKGWLTEDAAQRVVQFAGFDLAQLRAAAESREFRPVALGVSTTLDLECRIRHQNTRNVIGVLPGADPRLGQEYVVFMAHHDHLGLAAERDENGDQIYNGAIDNASGTASLLNIAKALANLEVRPRRSILFAFVGAEEQGLLGSEHFAAHPPVPAGKMAAVINIDGVNFLGKTHDLNLIGNGKTNLDSIVEAVAKWQHRTVVPDYFPDRGYYYRSDQFSLAKIGVPGIYLHSGVNVVGKPDGWGKQQLEDWVDETYHQPSDEYSEDWDLAGAIDDAQLLMQVGIVIANQEELPAWLPGDEFEAARQKALEAVRE
ncbi:M28 family peptidase [Aureliella helgolandensis]|uniref:Aminopeptidase S n=1 Tax=Aureliella helgolandensis TaxID=2527968 RepID=A0A518G2I7_9BACT|nr:M28 family peptidase [Aureliella helgolandensis]QDV22804.1 Aminopeptidase S [Aureliella helgolandensis]